MKLALVPGLILIGSLLGNAPEDDTPRLFRATLLREDFLRHTVSFDDGEPGKILQGRQVFNRDSDLDYGVYNSGFTVGIQGGQRGSITDLGHWSDLATRYQYQETVGGGQGFNSIRFKGGGLVILDDLQAQSTQPFTEGNDFLARDPIGSGSASTNLGHIYLVRVVDQNDAAYEHVAKFIVVDVNDNKSVTIVWENLQRAVKRTR